VNNNKYYTTWAFIRSLRYPECNAHAPYCHLCSALLYNICPHYLINDFRTQIIERKMCFDFLYKFYRNIFHSKKNCARYDKNIYIAYFCPIWMKMEFSGQIFETLSNIKFHENPSSGSRVVPYGQTDRRTDGQTDMTTLMVFFAILRSHLKSKALIVIKNGKRSRATYQVNCEQVQLFVHLLCLLHQQIWHSKKGHLTSRNISKQFISQVVKKLFRENLEDFYTDRLGKRSQRWRCGIELEE